jgi:hypothetical protein
LRAIGETEKGSILPLQKNLFMICSKEQPIEPIFWTVGEFVLIHSMYGHITM